MTRNMRNIDFFCSEGDPYEERNEAVELARQAFGAEIDVVSTTTLSTENLLFISVHIKFVISCFKHPNCI